MNVRSRRAVALPATALPATVLGALAALLAAAPPAAAHTGLTSADPTPNTVLSGPPRSVTLTFSDPMDPKYAQVAVTTADGAALTSGAPQVAGAKVSVPLREGAARPGTYTVGYRVVSADGHPVSGSYTFTVRAAAPSSPSPTPRPTARPTPSAAPSPSPRPTSDGTPVALAGAAGLLLVAGGCVVVIRRVRKGRA
ncbi:copper resistance CopC family protein [Streptomyces sp. NPDC090025]|uniref:copper resistance CopC family protein n=1 Tax=Streptomyces sp. NPDC090025 TaxID=3365922 RepID=UPI003834B50A